jgi:hypothetical protein
MNDVSKLTRCRVCGKRMKEKSAQEADIPLEAVRRMLPSHVDLSAIRRFECPNKHGGVVLIPAMTEEEREQALRERKHYTVN